MTYLAYAVYGPREERQEQREEGTSGCVGPKALEAQDPHYDQVEGRLQGPGLPRSR
jgi:hypothetical protein